MTDPESRIEAAILRLVAERGAGKTICPSEVARDLGGQRPENWRRLMPAIKSAAVRLAGQGEVAILRRGRPVADPQALAGIYRIGVPGGRDER